MLRVVTPGRLRRRLAITVALVVALAAGALAAGSYFLVRDSRLDDSRSRSLEQARTNLVLAGTVLEGSSAPEDVAGLLELYARRPGFETVALAAGEAFSSSFSVGAPQIPTAVTALVEAGELAYERVGVAGTRYLVVGGRAFGTEVDLFFFFSEQALADDLGELRTILLAGFGVMVALGAVVGAAVARRLLRPVARASAAAHALAEGLLETRLPVDRDDELGAWAASFNEMADALEQTIRALSLAQARERRFTSDVAHELRTPLTALVGEASLLEQQLDRMPPEARRPAELLVQDVGRLRRLVEELMEISRLDAGSERPQTEPVDLGGLAAQVLRARGWADRVALATEPVVVETDRRRVERVVSNLVANALVHGGRGVTVTVGRDATHAFVEVADTGPGIPEEHLPHLFERFYKADVARAGGGSGLGLAIALENARLLGGTIDVVSEPGAGSSFTLRLPVAEPLPGGEPPVSSGGDDEGGRRIGRRRP